MTIKSFTKTCCAMASLAYAAGYKRVGRNFLTSAICAVWGVDGEVVMSGPLPRARTPRTSRRRPRLRLVP